MEGSALGGSKCTYILRKPCENLRGSGFLAIELFVGNLCARENDADHVGASLQKNHF